MTVIAVSIHGQNFPNCCGQDQTRHHNSVSSFLLNTDDEQGMALSAGLCVVLDGGFQEGTALASRACPKAKYIGREHAIRATYI